MPGGSEAQISYDFTFEGAVQVATLCGLWDHHKDKALFNESYTTHLEDLFAQERRSNSSFVSAAFMQSLFDASSLREANKNNKENVRAYLDDFAKLTLHVDSRKGMLRYRNNGVFNREIVPCAEVLQVHIVAGLLESDMTSVKMIGVCADEGNRLTQTIV